MDKTAETLEQVLARIQGMLASQKAQQTMPQPSSESDSARKRIRWLEKWLKIKGSHPQLEALREQVYQFCFDYSKNPSRGRRMIIYGENGTGKSHTAKAVVTWAKRVAMRLPLVNGREEGESVRLATAEYWNWPETVDWMKSGHWEVIEYMLSSELLAIDDIGAEHDPSKMATEKLYLLLERREREWTILTTNIKPEEWEFRFERRISSRLLRNSVVVALDNIPDYNA